MTNNEAIDLAKRAIAPCKGATLQALHIVIAMAEKYNTACDTANRVNGLSENLEQTMADYNEIDQRAMTELANGADHFGLSVGPWTIQLDLRGYTPFGGNT